MSNNITYTSIEELIKAKIHCTGITWEKPYKPTYKELLNNHEELLSKLTQLVYEHDYKAVVEAILYCSWYEALEKSIAPKRYDVYVHELNEARITVQRFSNETIKLDLPLPTADTLTNLKEHLRRDDYTLEQIETITKMIKESFDRKLIRPTQHLKRNKSIKELFRLIKYKI